MYIPPSRHANQQIPPPLERLQGLLVHQGNHIVLGDFNLHHPLWNSPSYHYTHYVANDLLSIVGDIGARLLTPPGLATRNCQRGPHHEQTTIDLIFSTIEATEYCRIAEGLEQGSDHLPIETILLLPDKVIEQQQQPRLLWKDLDLDIFLSILDKETLGLEKRALKTRDAINIYVTTLSNGIQQAIKASVPQKKGSIYDKGFWTLECLIAVKTTRYFRRLYTRQPSLEAWNLFTRQRNSKGKILAKAKRDFYRRQVQEITTSQPWSLYKWAKKRNQGQNRAISLPTLRKGDREAISTEEKSLILRQEAFPTPRNAALDDLSTYSYPRPLSTQGEITIEEIRGASQRTKPDKAPGPDQIPNRVIHLLARHRISLLQTLFQACWDLSYHPEAFHTATTVFLRKPGKKDYTDPAAYRPIALLNTLGKTLESIIATRLKDLAEGHRLLPDSQYGARPNRSTETALFQIIEKIKAIQSYGLIPSLLALDVQKAFDNVSHIRLIHDLRKRRIPPRIIDWIKSFLSERSTSIRLGDYTSKAEKVSLGIPQGSPLSPILYLFYNADLLDEY